MLSRNAPLEALFRDGRPVTIPAGGAAIPKTKIRESRLIGSFFCLVTE
jgi:hypothetical protein